MERDVRNAVLSLIRFSSEQKDPTTTSGKKLTIFFFLVASKGDLPVLLDVPRKLGRPDVLLLADIRLRTAAASERNHETVNGK